MKHLGGTVKYAVLSAPSKNSDMLTVVPGINNEMLNEIEEKGNIVSAASCTTTCISPYIKLFEDKFGIESGFIDTTHAATGSQNIADKANSKAESKSRGSLDAMIPTTTGAAKAIGLVIPELNGKLIGSAQRVPVPTGSTTLLVAVVKSDKEVTKASINEYMKSVANESYGYTEEQLVSSDIIGSTYGSIFDATQTMVISLGNGLYQVQVVAWYDNENSYTSQMVRTIKYLSKVN